MKTITKFNLMLAFLNRTPIEIRGVNFDFLNRLEHETGSTHQFLVTGFSGGKMETVYFVTID